LATAIGAELAARDAALAHPPEPSIGYFGRLNTAAKKLIVNANRIADAYAVNEAVPFNFRVLAAQLGQDGAAIGIISSNYTLLSNEMKSKIADFIAAAQGVAKAINDGAFLVATARVQQELLSFFETEQSACPLPREPEMRLLDDQQHAYRAHAAEGLQDIAKKIEGVQQTCSDMTRLAAGLEVTRIMGKVECSRHTSVKDRLDELLNDLESFQKTIADALKEIERTNHAIRVEAQGLIAHARAA